MADLGWLISRDNTLSQSANARRCNLQACYRPPESARLNSLL